MNLTIVKGDLFTAPKSFSLCHCISADFALGAGIAKRFAELSVRDELIEYYGKADDSIGQCLVTTATEWRREYNLVTKYKFYHKPTYETLRKSLEDLKWGYEVCNCKETIAMPKIGCGLDKLKWTEVEKIIKDVFKDTDIEIVVYER